MFKLYFASVRYKQLEDKKTKEKIDFNVYSFLELNKNSKELEFKGTSVDKWFKNDNQMIKDLKLKLIYLVDLDINGKWLSIKPYNQNNNEQDFINKYSSEKQEQLSSNQQENKSIKFNGDDALLWD